jgi:hypothetical protein
MPAFADLAPWRKQPHASGDGMDIPAWPDERGIRHAMKWNLRETAALTGAVPIAPASRRLALDRRREPFDSAPSAAGGADRVAGDDPS